MLQAPTTDTKERNESSRTAIAEEPQREPHPLFAGIPSLVEATRRSVPSSSARLHQQLAALQRTVGNQAVLRMLRRSSQPQVARNGAAVGPILRRKCACGGSGGECEACKTKNEEGLLQRKAARAAEGAEAPAIVHDVLRSPGQPLDSATRAFFEPRFKQDFSRVRVHADAKASESAGAVSALAYTVGSDVVFAKGQYAPNSPGGQRLLAHELTHVVQQANAPGSLAKKEIKMGECNDVYEQDADRVASAFGADGRAGTAAFPVFATAPRPVLSRAWASCADPKICPPRDPGEQARAARAKLDVSSLSSPEMGEIVFGFDIGSSSVASLGANATWASFAAAITASADRWEILGFSDCEGGATENTRLRQVRANAVLHALPAAAQAQIDRAVPAAITDCVAANDSEANRRLNRSVVFRRTVINITFPPENITVPRTPQDLCGPDVTSQVKAAVAGIRATFTGWTSSQKEDACDALDSLRTGGYAWDIVELHNQHWISLNYRPPCASEPTDPHCGSSVQVGQDCYYAGSPNYVIFGAMCKLCYDYYYSIMLVNTGLARFTKSEMLHLIDEYKGHGFSGFATPSPNFRESELWAVAGYSGWPFSGSPAGDRPNCSPRCPIPYKGGAFHVNWYPNQFFTGNR
jgi:outer membrane protein OmpA-like peptidoglycan-associated protein